MKEIKANYHTHTYLCNHANGDVFDYVLKAIDLGFIELGFSDHNPIDLAYFDKVKLHKNYLNLNMSLYSFLNIYLKEIDEAIIKYKDKIKIYKGSETEFFIDDIEYYKYLRSKLDYMILGVHFYSYKGKLINSFSEINEDNVDGYFDTIISAIKSKLFKVIAHPDLFCVSYLSDFNTHFNKHILDRIDELCLEAIKNNVYLEFNINGIRNSKSWGYKDYKNYPYPNINFFEYIKKYQEDGLKIIIGLDAHDPSCLNDKAIELGLEIINKIGLKIEPYLKIND